MAPPPGNHAPPKSRLKKDGRRRRARPTTAECRYAAPAAFAACLAISFAAVERAGLCRAGLFSHEVATFSLCSPQVFPGAGAPISRVMCPPPASVVLAAGAGPTATAQPDLAHDDSDAVTTEAEDNLDEDPGPPAANSGNRSVKNDCNDAGAGARLARSQSLPIAGLAAARPRRTLYHGAVASPCLRGQPVNFSSSSRVGPPRIGWYYERFPARGHFTHNVSRASG